ncbi:MULTISPECIES: response regulator [unclassified Paenibacillus]|uniref:response regulator n=1 Tax=unclassified Paenibacillus TaxID=185978 RepID=UPI0007BFE459|nr:MULTISPECIES: response regulator [unclassified Paenibacillus]OAX45970.1 Transcriptional regulatory protein YpdB [Paenibacillus sp. AD87]SEB19886.1 Two-component response regulator, SAPR family, consists of REC, wHTH and BTAD domains [Paenibacillus sp. 276b]
MKAIVIDDEKPAQLHLERLLRSDGRITPVQCFSTARAGLDFLAKERVDVVFLDIGMPEMNGLEAAEYIQQLDSSIRIIFITAYADHAVEAFELQALDYVLKPVSSARLAKTIDRIAAGMISSSSQVAATAEVQESEAVELDTRVPGLLTFKHLDIYRSLDQEAEKHKWRTAKSQELFAFLFHHRGDWVSKEILLDKLWADVSQEKGLTHLHTSVYQIRKLLKEWNMTGKLEYNMNRYRLLSGNLVSDVEQFEQGMAYADVTSDNVDQLRDIVPLYRGDYLEEHDYRWAQAKARDLRSKYIGLVMDIAEWDMKHGRGKEAMEQLSELQEREPYAEEICRLMMRVSASMDDQQAILRIYHSFTLTLLEELGHQPEPETSRLYEDLTAK